MTHKPFFREANIWRLIGLLIGMGGVILAITHPEIIVFEGYGVTANLGVLLIVLGFLGFYPTIKEALTNRAKR